MTFARRALAVVALGILAPAQRPDGGPERDFAAKEFAKPRGAKRLSMCSGTRPSGSVKMSLIARRNTFVRTPR